MSTGSGGATEMEDEIRGALGKAAETFGTPCYVYFLEPIAAACARLRQAFGGRFALQFAAKSNPNTALLRALRPHVDGLDVSSAGEITRGLAAGYSASALSFTGPGKSTAELEAAVAAGCGAIVCEADDEIDELEAVAGRLRRTQEVLLRINPARVPRGYPLHMGGRPSQFGIDEEAIGATLDSLADRRHLSLAGFHVYSGTNALDAAAVCENFEIMCGIFERTCERDGLCPTRLVFGPGFGIPYHDGEAPLDIDAVAAVVNPRIDRLLQRPACGRARLVMELGRYIVGPHGFLLTSVVRGKRSRGIDVYVCDSGLNHNQPAFNLFGTVLRRNWMIEKIGRRPGEPLERCILAGPLCTSLDTLATDILLPRLTRGDVLAVASSGAYGLSASPLHFISRPEPREALVTSCAGDTSMIDVTEPHHPLTAVVR